MVMFFVELRKAEVPLTLACFCLPLVVAIFPLVPGADHLSWCTLNVTEQAVYSSAVHFIKYNMILGMATTGLCFVAIVTATLCLAYHSLRWHFSRSSDEELSLLQEHDSLRERTKKRYQKALKESLPFAIYPIVCHFVLLIYYLDVVECHIKAMFYLFVFMHVSIGCTSSIIFFVHVAILGRRKRNKFRKKSSRVLVCGSKLQAIQDEDVFTSSGSMTWTNVTGSEPPTDSD